MLEPWQQHSTSRWTKKNYKRFQICRTFYLAKTDTKNSSNVHLKLLRDLSFYEGCPSVAACICAFCSLHRNLLHVDTQNNQISTWINSVSSMVWYDSWLSDWCLPKPCRQIVFSATVAIINVFILKWITWLHVCESTHSYRWWLNFAVLIHSGCSCSSSKNPLHTSCSAPDSRQTRKVSHCSEAFGNKRASEGGRDQKQS